MSELILEASGLHIGYEKGDVLRGIDLQVHRGELWFFAGPNGAGKTTLLKAILGAIPARAGGLHLSPRVAEGWRVGFVPQRCDLKRTLPMTVADFVLLGFANMRTSRREARGNVSWALGTVGLAELGRRNYWSLSGGQRQRALVARGLVRKPELLLLDEPTNGLDLGAEEALLQLVSRLHREEEMSIIFVTHFLSLAARLATHVALFQGGRVVAGPVEEVLSAPRLAGAYGIDVEVVRSPGSLPVVRVNAPGGFA